MDVHAALKAPPRSAGRLLPKVLLVDDQPEALLALDAALQALPVDRVVARSGYEALDRLLEDAYAAVLLDVQMPGLDGIETARRIRSDPSLAHLPLIFVTGHGQEHPEKFQAYALGAVDFIGKPFEVPVLRAKVGFFVELFERSREARESRARYEAIAEASPVGLFQADAQGDCLYVNPRWCEILGITAERSRGRGWLDGLHPDDRARVVDAWDAAVRSGRPFRAEYRVLRPDGRLIWVLGQARGEADAAGRSAAYVGTVTDVTERKLAEEAAGEDQARRDADLRRTREELALIADALPVLISSVDKDARYVRVNRGYERWFGLRREDVEGLLVRELVGESAWERIHPHVEAALSGREARFEALVPYRFGGSRLVRGEYLPYRDPSGAVAGFVSVETDLSQSRRSETALRFLSEASRVLSSSLDYEATIAKVADLVVQQISDWCLIDIAEGRSIRRLAVAHRDPEQVACARAVHERYPIDLDDPLGVPNVFRTGEPELYPEITDEMLQQGAKDAAHLQLLRAGDGRSCMLVPLGPPGRVVGVLTCISSDPVRRLGPEDLELARALAERAALAIENAQLYRERTRQKERAHLLADASRLFAESHLDLPVLMDRLAELLVPSVADSCCVRRLSEDGRWIRTLAVRHRNPAMQERERELAVAPQSVEEGITGEVLRSGKPVFWPVVDEDQVRCSTVPRNRPHVSTARLGSFIMVALRAHGAVVGALGIGRQPDRPAFTPDDLEVAQKIADRAGLALATWDAFAQVRKEKEALQKSQAELQGHVDDLTRLHDFSTRTEGHLDVDRVMRDLLGESIRLQGAGMGFVELVDRERNALVVSASVGHRPDAVRQLGPVPIGEGHGACGTAAARCERVVVEDVEADPLFEPYRGFAAWAGFRAVWSVPLMGRGGELLGVLSTHFPRPRRPSPREIHLVELYAAQAAHVVENARLVLDARRAEEEARCLNAELEARVHERTAKLHEMLRELETFSYSVAHDLRAPLRAMEGFGQILLEGYADPLDEGGRDLVRRICAAGVRMDRMVQDLLAYSRLSREDIDLTLLSLDAVVDAALAQVESAVESAGGTVEVAPSLPTVRGNAVMLAQAVANLLCNALKFVAAGVKPVVRIRGESRGTCVRLWIEDNGIGIAREYQARIFRVFERLHVSAAYPGTGIGLAIVRRALERMGGAAGVESEAGQGSRFWVELPAAGVLEETCRRSDDPTS
jgi:PAS domain S-box-containing protein